jgi:hypothetical protein
MFLKSNVMLVIYLLTIKTFLKPNIMLVIYLLTVKTFCINKL